MTSPIKCVVIGDGNIGKTCLVTSFIQNAYNPKYIPTVFDTYQTKTMFNDQTYEMLIKDTAGDLGYDRLRPLAYTDADCFLICFSVVDSSSFDNIKTKWIKEIQNHSPNTPFILVGLQSDLRNHMKTCMTLKSCKQTPISYKKGADLAKKLRKVECKKYAECSAMTQNGLQNVFHEVVFAVRENRMRKMKGKE